MSDFFDTIGKRISDTVDDLGKKAGDTIDIQKKKNEIYGLKRDSERDMTEIGRLVYERFKPLCSPECCRDCSRDTS